MKEGERSTQREREKRGRKKVKEGTRNEGWEARTREAYREDREMLRSGLPREGSERGTGSERRFWECRSEVVK